MDFHLCNFSVEQDTYQGMRRWQIEEVWNTPAFSGVNVRANS